MRWLKKSSLTWVFSILVAGVKNLTPCIPLSTSVERGNKRGEVKNTLVAVRFHVCPKKGVLKYYRCDSSHTKRVVG
jgi:hypothetical protein